MTRFFRLPRAGTLLVCAAATTLLASASACGQTPAPAGGAQRGASTAAAAPATLDSLLPRVQASRAKGQDGAPVTIVEVSDFQCPYCRQWVETTYRQLDSAYIQTGKVRMLFVSFPLPNHREAWAASEAAFCAGAQGQFWPMHDRLFAQQREWSGQADAPQRFTQMAEALRLDMAAYRDCTENDRVSTILIQDLMGATTAGIQGTPTFILNGQKAMTGAVTFEQMRTEIEALLAGGGAAPQQPGQAPPAQTPPAPTPPGS